MVYDVDLNSDIFYRECPDGVFSCRFCTLQGTEQPLAVVGGNCSVVGFGWQGTELFWNVAGDDVRCVAPCEGDLLVGSDDYEIRIFRKEESIYEISEADKVVALCSLGKEDGSRSGWRTGLLGVYKNNERRWRVKSKNALVAVWKSRNMSEPSSGETSSRCAGWSSGERVNLISTQVPSLSIERPSFVPGHVRRSFMFLNVCGPQAERLCTIDCRRCRW